MPNPNLLPFPSRTPPVAAVPKPEMLTKPATATRYDDRVDTPAYAAMGDWADAIKKPVVGREPLSEDLFNKVNVHPNLHYWGVTKGQYVFNGGREYTALHFNGLNTGDNKIPQHLILTSKTPLSGPKVSGL